MALPRGPGLSAAPERGVRPSLFRVVPVPSPRRREKDSAEARDRPPAPTPGPAPGPAPGPPPVASFVRENPVRRAGRAMILTWNPKQ